MKKVVVVNAGPRMGWNTETLVCGDTLQLKDYDATDWKWTMFDPDHKQKRHDKTFPKYCKKAYDMGAELVK